MGLVGPFLFFSEGRHTLSGYRFEPSFPSRKWGVVYEDNHVLVAFKPHGLITQSDVTGEANLLDLLKSYLKEKYAKPGNVFLGLVHRLDKATAGLLVFGRTSKGASRLSAQVREKSLAKHYLALVGGNLSRGTHHFEDSLLVTKGRVSVDPQGKQSLLGARVLAAHSTGSVLLLRLKTGRKHQIRVQLAHRGHPILGDGKYGEGKAVMALLAYSLAFTHPTTQKRHRFRLGANALKAWCDQFGVMPSTGAHLRE